MATNLSRNNGRCNFSAGGDNFIVEHETAAGSRADVRSPPPSPGPVQIAYEYERWHCHWTAVAASTSTIAAGALCAEQQRRFCSASSPSSPRSSFRLICSAANDSYPTDHSSAFSNHCHFLAVPSIAIQRIHRRMSAVGSAEMGRRGGADKRKKKHPQLLRLTGQRTQSCTDFSSRLTNAPALLPSSMAAAALSAKRINESGAWDSSELFTPPFQRMPAMLSPVSGSAPASASPTGKKSANLFQNKQHEPAAAAAAAAAVQCHNNGHRPLHSSDSGSCSAPPSLSPERRATAARSRSSRFCCSFRRTLKRTPKRERLVNESNSNISNVGSERIGGVEKKESLASMAAHPSPEESQLLAKAWSRKESRTLILSPDKCSSAGNGRERVDSSGAASVVADGGERSREGSTFSLRRLSKAFFQEKDDQRTDLMNDWEIGGTPNPWVCPSDRHLQLRAQLKSGWSVRTANARSPTTSKQQQALSNGGGGAGGISEAEQAHIQKVLERAEAGRQNEQLRICKMIERLERLRARATGNGVTQCLLCQTEFGLLAAKSYAAMCSDCRKYVCQRNCGVETFDQKRREPIFLCKICSEYREVMWKKSGAWFYREVPLPPSSSRPASAMAGSITMMSNGGPGAYLPPSPSARSNPPIGSQTGPMQRKYFEFGVGNGVLGGGGEHRMPPSAGEGTNQPRTDGGGRLEQYQQNNHSQHHQQRNRALPVPIPTEQQQRLKTTPRPRIIPSWVHEGLQQSSVSVDDDSDGESASSSTSSSLEPAQFRKSLVAAKERALSVKQHAAAHIFGGNAGAAASGGVRTTNKTKSRNKSGGADALGHRGPPGTQKLQRVALGRAGRLSDTDSENERSISRRSSPSTSPRHSLATPSSYGGDDVGGQNGQSGAIGTTRGGDGTGPGGEQTLSDSRSVDSGVVQSDHSAQQQATADGLVAFAAHSQLTPVPPVQQEVSIFQQRLALQTPSPVPPPIPPRSATIAANCYPPKTMLPNTASLCHQTNFAYPPSRRPASAAATPSAALIKLRGHSNCGNNSGSSHESIPAKVGAAASRGMGFGGVHELVDVDHALMTATTSSASLAPDGLGGSRRSTQSTAPPTKEDRADLEEGEALDEEQMDGPINRHNSPTFMSSPEDDSKHLRTLGSRRDAFVSLRPFGGNSVASPTRAPCHKTQSLGVSHPDQQRLRRPMLTNPSVSIESAHSDESVDDIQQHNFSNYGTEFGHCANLGLSATTPKRPHSANSLPTIDENSGTLGSIQFNLTYLVDDKQLIIHLIRAKNLKAMDKNGFSDPYVKFHLLPGNIKATKLTSRTIEKTLNPEWNEEMIYYGITEDERQRKSLRITVLDRDRIGSDFLGETRVALRKLPLGQTKKFNLYLEHAMPMPAKGLGGSNKSVVAERGKLLLAVQYNIQQGSLFVSIKRCAELLGMDSTGFSDPYCKVSLTPLTTKAHRQRTAIRKRTLNPEFNEVLQFIVPFKDLPRKTLVIGVYDYDVGRHDDYIGGIVLSTAAPDERGRQWQHVIENPGKSFEHWHRLEVDD